MIETIKKLFAVSPATMIAGVAATLIGGIIGINTGGALLGLLVAAVAGVAGAFIGSYADKYLDERRQVALSNNPANSKPVIPASKDNPEHLSVTLRPDDQMLKNSQTFLNDAVDRVKKSDNFSTMQKITTTLTLTPIARKIPILGREIQADFSGKVDGDNLHVDTVRVASKNTLLSGIIKQGDHDVSDKNISLPLIKAGDTYEVPMDHPDTLIALGKSVGTLQGDAPKTGPFTEEMIQWKTTQLASRLFGNAACAHLVEGCAQKHGTAGAQKLVDYYIDSYVDMDKSYEAYDRQRAELFKQVIAEKYKSGELVGKSKEEISAILRDDMMKAQSTIPADQTPNMRKFLAPDLSDYASGTLADIHQSLSSGLAKGNHIMRRKEPEKQADVVQDNIKGAAQQFFKEEAEQTPVNPDKLVLPAKPRTDDISLPPR